MTKSKLAEPQLWSQLTRSLDRLAERLLAGEVVFFVGAGLSFDSEGNSTLRLLGRLLARFEGMAEILIISTSKEDAQVISRLRSTLRSTFTLKNPRGTTLPETSLPTLKHLKQLVPQYYIFNDWIINALSQLLTFCCLTDDPGNLAMKINGHENYILSTFKDKYSLPLIDFNNFNKDSQLERSNWGKILFLETLGFADSEIMCGSPSQHDSMAVAVSYENKLLGRHHVLARLAREGLCPTLLTTNYDLLLEGAYRLAGFSFDQGKQEFTDCAPLTLSDNRRLVRVGEARDFFEHARTHRSTQLIKIHGCADRYRTVREDFKSWQAYLPSVVFTFREIQNWREDSWSRDLVSTLLRTRTLVFCGYSAADPVLHDTFRTVYEEMARRWGVNPETVDKGLEDNLLSEQAPAFAFGRVDGRDFHVLEVLRAASRAIGVTDPTLDDHPNYLPVHFLDANMSTPTYDHALLWLHHCTLRKLQARHLRRELYAMLPAMLGELAPASDVASVLANFDEIYAMEQKAASRWLKQPVPEFINIISWTWDFHPALMRELACSAATTRHMGTTLQFKSHLRQAWIIPTSDRPDWSAWGAVLEIALRRVAAYLAGKEKSWAKSGKLLTIGRDLHPNLTFTPNPNNPTTLKLEIRLAVHSSTVKSCTSMTGAARQCTWSLPFGHLPWPRHTCGQTPSAYTLLSWACGRLLKDSHKYFGSPQQWSKK